MEAKCAPSIFSAEWTKRIHGIFRILLRFSSSRKYPFCRLIESGECLQSETEKHYLPLLGKIHVPYFSYPTCFVGGFQPKDVLDLRRGDYRMSGIHAFLLGFLRYAVDKKSSKRNTFCFGSLYSLLAVVKLLIRSNSNNRLRLFYPREPRTASMLFPSTGLTARRNAPYLDVAYSLAHFLPRSFWGVKQGVRLLR